MFKKSVIILVALGFVLVFACSALAVTRVLDDAAIAEMIADAPSAEQYPQASAYVLADQTTITINPDSSAVTDYRLVVKLFQDRARDKFADRKQLFNADAESVVVVRAVTHLADGSTMEVEEKAIHELTPMFLSNAAVYSNIMQKVVSFPAVAPGVTLDLHLRKYTAAPEEPEDFFVWGTDLFRGTEPYGFVELSVTLPENFNLDYTYQNDGVDYSTSSAGGMITHNWTNEWVPQIIPEPYMPGNEFIAPRLIYTTAESWDIVGKWIGEKFYPHVVTDGDVKNKAEDLIEGADSQTDKIDKIALYVIKEIRGVGEYSLPLGIAGYEPNDADEVLANKYGDWRDKSVLLVSLLRAAGVEAYPHFVKRSAAPLAKEHPTMKQFDAVFVYVPDYGGQPLWIDPFSDQTEFGYCDRAHGATGLLVRNDGSELLDVVDPTFAESKSDCRFEFRLMSNGDVDGTFACQLTGFFDVLTRQMLQQATPKEREQFFQKAANSLGEGTTSEDFKLSDLNDLLDTARIAQDFLSPAMGIVQGDMMIFRLPLVPFGVASSPVVPGQEMRQYPLQLDTELLLKKQGVIHLPTDFKVVYAAEPVKLESEFGVFESSYQISEDSSSVIHLSTMKFTDDFIDTDEYFDFKASFDEFTKPRHTLILLERKKAQ